MNTKQLLPGLTLVLALTACTQVAPEKPVNQEIEEPVTIEIIEEPAVETPVIEEPQELSMNEAITKLIQDGHTLSIVPDFIWGLAENHEGGADFVQRPQILQSDTYWLGDGNERFAFVVALQPTMNFNIDIKADEVKWVGLMVADGQTEADKKFFTVSGDDQNIVDFFIADRAFYIDVVDTNGAGSGEGHMTRFVSKDGGKTWTEEGCYYYAPEGIKPSSTCAGN